MSRRCWQGGHRFFPARTEVLLLAAACVIGCGGAPDNSDGAAPLAAAAAFAKLSAIKIDTANLEAEAETEIYSEFWLEDDPVQGAVILARAPSGADKVTLDGQPLAIEPDGFFLIGFDRDSADHARLAAKLDSGKTIEKNIRVRPGDWRIERVTAPATGTAKTTAEFRARRAGELAQINAARAVKTDSGGWRQDFIWPAKGRVSGVFGSQRIYQGVPGSYHSGLDIAAPAGTPFATPADGVVILAAETPFTLEGYLLIIDHGMGLSSAFLHCSALLVQKGDRVKQGQVIGRVGSTGRSTGPHLHWGMKWNVARVDPRLLLPKG